MIGDDAAFYLNGKVKSNIRQYAPRNNPPDFNFDVRMSREKLCLDGNLWKSKSCLAFF